MGKLFLGYRWYSSHEVPFGWIRVNEIGLVTFGLDFGLKNGLLAWKMGLRLLGLGPNKNKK